MKSHGISKKIKYTHRTRDGRKARIVAVLNGERKYPVLAVILHKNGIESYYDYTADLRFYEEDKEILDLFELQPVTFHVYRATSGEIYMTNEPVTTSDELLDTFTKNY